MNIEALQQSDEDLALKCQAGEAAFFGELYNRYAEKIYNFIYYRARHKQTAEDLTAQVFFRALDKISGFKSSKGKFSSWIYQIARNSLIDSYRAGRPLEDIENVWDLVALGSVERDTDTKLAMEKVAKYLSGLNSQQREIVLMRLWDGLSYKEISEILNLGESNCKMIFSRTLAKLQQDLPLAFVLLLVMKNL